MHSEKPGTTRVQGLQRLAQEAHQRAAWDHRPMAGARPQRSELRGYDSARPLLHLQPQHGSGLKYPVRDHLRGAEEERGTLKFHLHSTLQFDIVDLHILRGSKSSAISSRANFFAVELLKRN